MNNFPATLRRQPVYEAMVNDIRQSVERGDLRPGQALMSERKLAEKYEIAYLSVRKGIKELQDKGILFRIARRGVFVAERMAKSGAPTLNICFFASSLSLSIWVRALSGIEKAVSAHGHSLNFIEGGKDKLFRYLKNNTPDGMIIINPEAEFYNKLQRFYPMVRIITLGNNTYAPGASTVRAENSIGAFMAVEHLIKLGAKKITYIGPGIDSGNGAERYEGYLKALKVNGLKPQRIHNPASDAERAELVAGLKNKRLIPEAFFCFSDIVAMQLIKALNKVGFSVPEDILLAGFSNLREAEYFYPSITTVDTNHEEMGRVAAESLIGLVEGREGGRIESEISARLIIRESTMLRKGKN